MMIPDPPRYYNSNWKLLSQGAEARVWLVPNFISGTTNNNNTNNNTTCTTINTTNAICKERFVKSYRHPMLNDKLTRARTKAEAKSLCKCRRGGVSVPIILGVDIPHASASTGTNTNGSDSGNGNDNMNNSSACLFLERIEGCTLRSFFTIKVKTKTRKAAEAEAEIQIEAKGNGEAEEVEEEEVEQSQPAAKKPKLDPTNSHANTDANVGTNAGINDDKSSSTRPQSQPQPQPQTRLDEYAKKVAHATGIAIGKMHNINIIHGDLTTSNILLRNSNDVPSTTVSSSTASTTSTTSTNHLHSWKPDIVMIDFGLSSTSVNTSSKNKNSSSSSHEERAVDLYVLERAFVTTHVGGEVLVEELLRGYKKSCKCSDSVFVRLSQVRLRGRKRDCFG